SDIIGHPTLPATVLVVTGLNGGTNGLYRSDDSGGTFAATGLERGDLHFSTVRVAPSNSDRIYVAGTREAPYQGYILRSDDGAAHWTELPQDIPPQSNLYLLAVSPANPDVLFVHLASTPNTILRTTNAGASFAEVLQLQEGVRSAEISDDGQTVWIA